MSREINYFRDRKVNKLYVFRGSNLEDATVIPLSLAEARAKRNGVPLMHIAVGMRVEAEKEERREDECLQCV